MENGKQQSTNKNDAYRFETNASKGELTKLLVPSLQKMAKKQQWNLGDREYRDLNANMLFEIMTTASVKVLWLDFNKRSKIIQQIVIPSYSQLTALYLGDNNLSSINVLSILDAPFLEKLYLNHNKISSLKALRISSFPALTDLNLNGNCIQDQSWLCFCHFPKLIRLNLGYVNKKQQISEERWYLKSQLNDESVIQSPKHKLGIFTTKILRTTQPPLTPRKSLFKMFQNG